ncbi:MAG: hypothetical protein M9894_07875 [Planctomycetes bacterium]|nr:hypothetical protein [Planctomycetota bacterium]
MAARAASAATALLLGAHDVARACTVCGSERGADLRAGILEGDLLVAAAGVVVPFLALLGAAALVGRGAPPARGGGA